MSRKDINCVSVRPSSISSNIMITNVTDCEKEILFGPFTGEEEWVHFQEYETVGHILHKTGLIKSLSWAKQNGWNKPIPKGFSEFTFGKLKHQITIFNKEEWPDGW